MNALREYELILREYELIVSGFCASIMFFGFFSKVEKHKKRVLLWMEIGSVLLLMADYQVYLFRDTAGEKAFWDLRICKFIVFFMSVFIVHMFNRYLMNFYLHEVKLFSVPKRLKAAEILAFTGEALVIISQFTGLYYTFDEANHYHREKYYIISYLIPVMMWLLQFSVIFQYRKKYDKKFAIALMLVPVLPLVAACIQLFMQGMPLINLTIVGLVIMLRVFEVRNTNWKITLANQREKQLLREEQANMRSMMEETSYALAEAIEAKDEYTHGHSSRVAQYSEMIAELAGKDEKERQNIYLAGLLHDVGKIGIPEGIINKDSKLTDEEYAIIKTHPVIGNQILQKIKKNPDLSIGAHYHHERYDGRGYPEGLKGEEIPEIARIIAVADAYDAMTSKRSYRDILPQEVVRNEIVKGKGTQFDPEFAEIMLTLIDKDTEYSMKEK